MAGGDGEGCEGVAQVVDAGVLQLGAGHFRHREVAGRRQDELVQAAAIFPRRAGLQADGDVLGVEPLRQLPTVTVVRFALRSAAGYSPLQAAAMISIARLRACAQVNTVAEPSVIRRERRPVRYCTT